MIVKYIPFPYYSIPVLYNMVVHLPTLLNGLSQYFIILVWLKCVSLYEIPSFVPLAVIFSFLAYFNKPHHKGGVTIFCLLYSVYFYFTLYFFYFQFYFGYTVFRRIVYFLYVFKYIRIYPYSKRL